MFLPVPDRKNSVVFPAFLSAVLAGIFTFCANYEGVLFFFDSLSYWQGSVSLLQGGGYKNFYPNDFHHVMVAHWPPLFSLYLAGVQWIFGISGFSLILSLVFIAVCSAFVWTYLFCSFCGEENRWARFALAASVASLASSFSRSLISDGLSVLLIGVLLLLVVRFFSPQSPLYTKSRAKPALAVFSVVSLSAVLAACILTRKANILFIPAIWLAVLLFVRTAEWRRPVFVCAVLGALSLLIYSGVVSILSEPGGNDGHTIHFGAHSLETLRYLREFWWGIENSVFLGMGGGASLALMLFLFACAVQSAIYGRFRFEGEKIKKAAAPVVLIAVHIAGVFCLMHLITYRGKYFSFEARYIWQLTMALSGVFGIAVTYFPVPSRRRIATTLRRSVFPVTFALVCAVQVFNAGKYAAVGVLAQIPPPILHTPLIDPTMLWRVPRNHTIRRGYFRPPVRLSNGTVLVPPVGPFWWQKDADENVRDFMWKEGGRAFAYFWNIPADDPRRTADVKPVITYGNTTLRLFENMPQIQSNDGPKCPPDKCAVAY